MYRILADKIDSPLEFFRDFVGVDLEMKKLWKIEGGVRR